MTTSRLPPAPIVVVTGTSSGLGLELSLEFARRGAVVFAGMRDRAKAGDLQRRAADESLTVESLQLDVLDPASVAAAVAAVVRSAGRIDVLVNNAGIGGGRAVETTSEEEFRIVFETNVFGVIRMLHEILPVMRQQGSGTILQVSSLSGLIPNPFTASYTASKHALEALSEALRFEVEPFGIRVVIVEPGVFRTQLVANSSARRTVDPSSPYAEIEEAMRRRAERVIRDAPQAAQAARQIADAAYDTGSRFRYLIGDHAAAAARARQTLSEDEWADRIRAALRGEGAMGSA